MYWSIHYGTQSSTLSVKPLDSSSPSLNEPLYSVLIACSVSTISLLMTAEDILIQVKPDLELLRMVRS